MAENPADDTPLTEQELREVAAFLRGLGLAFQGHELEARMYALAAELDPSLHRWDGPRPEAPRDAYGLLIADPDADDTLRCGLCGRVVPALAPGRSICGDCAHFPLD